MEATRGRPRFGHSEVFALLAAASFLAARFLPLLDLSYTCTFRALTGLPCATCGMTHAFVHLAHGRPGAAAEASPLGALLAAIAWGYPVLDLARLAAGRRWPALGGGAVRALAGLGVAALLLNWAWLLAAARGAP